MTDRFQVSEPSSKAHAAAATIINDTVDQLGGFDAGGDALRAAYAIDLPAIVRDEVERALGEMTDAAPVTDRTAYGVGCEVYIEQRFGVVGGGCHREADARDKTEQNKRAPKPSPTIEAPFTGPLITPEEHRAHTVEIMGRVRRDIREMDTLLAQSGKVVVMDALDGRTINVITEAERAFLWLFVRDYLAQVDLPAGLVRGADTVAAARDLLAEGEP